MRSMVEGGFHKGHPLGHAPSVRPSACHLPLQGRNGLGQRVSSSNVSVASIGKWSDG